jgi:uncharacterized RDD family membrane protein YckC
MEQEHLLARELPDAQEDVWRQEVQARVTGYRSRKGRSLEGAFSMRFPFPPAEVVTEEEQVSAMAETATPVAPVGVVAADEPSVPSASAPGEPAENLFTASAQPAPVQDLVEPAEVSAPRPRSRRKVIAFPKAATVQDEEQFLLEQPRIFEVPEELHGGSTTPLLDGLQFHREESANAVVERLDLPVQPAGLAQRVRAGAADCAIVLAAAAAFAAAGFKFLPKIAVSKPLLLTAAAIPFLLWGVYQYLFVIYGGCTAGMRLAGIQLRSFRGQPASSRQRRTRVLGLYFSAASLMMGLLWALVDADSLGWHDRISGTYMTRS